MPESFMTRSCHILLSVPVGWQSQRLDHSLNIIKRLKDSFIYLVLYILVL